MGMGIPVEILITAASLIGAGGCAWGGAKVALNGTRQRVKEIAESHVKLNEKMDAHIAHDAQVQVDIVAAAARTEGKVDLILERLSK